MLRIRFRTDSAFAAEDAARIDRGEEPKWHNADDPDILDTPVAFPGDCWRTRWHSNEGEGPIAGYAICCPKCQQVHHWCSARNCPQDVPWSVTGSDGVEYTGMKCRHSGVGSCWNWSGSAEDRRLTASPSLHCPENLGGCGWHGWLTDGILKEC